MLNFIGLTMINMVLLITVFNHLGLRINVSESAPIGLYKRTSDKVKRNTLVEACLPDSVSTLMLQRDYASPIGNCKGYPAVMKRVVAMAGDAVIVGENISVNGAAIENSYLIDSDSEGRPLKSSESSTVSTDHVWLMSTHVRNSYDSRYYGEIPDEYVLSAVKPIWVIQ